eukprot:scaffold2771_cov252-Pinguiococcus_pyrenoidosus.AAC.6
MPKGPFSSAIVCAAAQKDPPQTVKIMSKHIRNPSIARYGLRKLAALDFEELEDGSASRLTLQSVKAALTLMEHFSRDTGIQAGCLEVLNSVASRHVNRNVILQQRWSEAFEWSVRSCSKSQTEGNVPHSIAVLAQIGDGVSKVVVEEPTQDSLSVCQELCSILAQLAYDVQSRVAVAEIGIDIVLRVLDFVDFKDGLSAIAASRALYNFVYRCEEAHHQTTERNCLRAVEKLLANLRSDDDVVLYATRAKTALEPDGWRGDVELQEKDVA